MVRCTSGATAMFRSMIIAGVANVMADYASCLWHLSNTDMLTHFATTYPQASPWQLHKLAPLTASALTGALSRQGPKTESLTNESNPPPRPGGFGVSSAPNSLSTPNTYQPIPSPLLQVFAQRLRFGTIAPGYRPVRSCRVEDAVGQAYASMGPLTLA
jgi:hypothetical protein